jgi:hypothetical protein
VCSHHLHTTPAPLSAVLGDAIPVALEQIVMDCLAKDAALRPSSAAELARRLMACERSLETSVSTAPGVTPCLEPTAPNPPLCLVYLRAQRALERLDAVLAAEARAAQALAATCPIAA